MANLAIYGGLRKIAQTQRNFLDKVSYLWRINHEQVEYRLMVSSAEIAILTKVSELAQRVGLRASDAEAFIFHVNEDDDPRGAGYSGLHFPSVPTDPDKAAKFQTMGQLIGIDPDAMVKAEYTHELEDILNRALSLAPRARIR